MKFRTINCAIRTMLSMLLLTLILEGCSNDPVVPDGQQQNGSTLKFVLNDNFNFGVVYGALLKTNLLDSLAKPGPYTFLAPDNNAFAMIGVGYPLQSFSFGQFAPSDLLNKLRYYTLEGKVVLKQLPLADNKPYKTHTGGNIYVSRYLDGTDTVTTINGQRLLSTDNAASNGLIQVLPQVINPEVFTNALSCLRSDTSVTLFTAAVQRAGLDVSVLQGNDVYTILAPSNTAFQRSAKLGLNLGISTLDSILKADPVMLAALLKYHIMKGRYFDGDLFRYSKQNANSITMLNSGKVTVGGIPGGFLKITFTGKGNNNIPAAIAQDASYSKNPTVVKVNIPAGNAVIHIIDRVLIP